MGNEELMSVHRETFEEKLDDLKFILQLCNIDLKAIKTEPELGTAAKKLLKEKGIEVL